MKGVHQILYEVSCGILCHYDILSIDISSINMFTCIVIDDEAWMKSMPLFEEFFEKGIFYILSILQ